MHPSKSLQLIFVAVVLMLGGCAAITDESADQAFDEQKYDEARHEYLKLTKDGDAHADARLGYMYEYDLGTRGVNLHTARKMYLRAAKLGDLGSAAALGNLYQWYGADYKDAYKWDMQAAQAGDGMAEANLAVLFEHGFGVTEDHAAAEIWRQKADQHPWGDMTVFASAATAAIANQVSHDNLTIVPGARGIAQVGFDYQGTGQAVNVQIEQSSGDKDLDALALRTVADTVLPPLPPDVKAKISHFSINIDFIQISQYRQGVVFWP